MLINNNINSKVKIDGDLIISGDLQITGNLIINGKIIKSNIFENKILTNDDI